MARAVRPRRNKPSKPPERTRHAWRWGALVLLVIALSAGTWWSVANRGWLAGGDAGQLNVLLVTMDTTRADYLGCYGRAGNRTPNIDRIAREGALFTRCTTCSPLTLPSHASILTSLYPYTHGARHNGTGRLADQNTTLAETLQAAGFHTQAAIASTVLNRKFGTDQGFAVYHDVSASAADEDRTLRRRGDDVCNDALAMLRSLAQERFFLWVHFYDPHYPYSSPQHPDRESPAAYEDQISFMDAQIGRLMAGLTPLGLQRRTLVVLVADHGEAFGEHDERMHGNFLYETTVHAPLIMWCPPRLRAGRKVACEVRTIDIAPTILELVGLPAWGQAQGASLAPLLSGKTSDLKLASYSESLLGKALFHLSTLRSLSVGGLKYIHAPRGELYDVARDPAESRNLAEEMPTEVAALRDQMRSLLAAAPPPPPKEERAVTLTASDRAKLEALGYVGTPEVEESDDKPEIERFEPRGSDPKDYARPLERMERVAGALQDREYALAEQMLDELITDVPDVPSLHVNLAQALRGQGHLPEADAQYRQALALAPRDFSTRHTYGRFLLFTAQRFTEAVRQFEIALAQDPDDVNLLHDYAVALMGLGQLDRAEQHLQRALDQEPDDPRLVQAFGVLRLNQRRQAEAAEYFRRALALDPNCAEAQAALQWLGGGRPPGGP